MIGRINIFAPAKPAPEGKREYRRTPEQSERLGGYTSQFACPPSRLGRKE